MHSLQCSMLGTNIHQKIHGSHCRDVKGFSILPKLVPLASMPSMTAGPCTAHTSPALQEIRRIPCGH